MQYLKFEDEKAIELPSPEKPGQIKLKEFLSPKVLKIEEILSSAQAFKVPDQKYGETDYGKAKKHRRARRVSRHSSASDEYCETCECCGYPIENQQLPLMAETEEIFDVSPTMAMYIYFTRCFVYFMLAFSILSGIPNMMLNSLGTHCDDIEKDDPYHCERGFFTITSLGNVLSPDSFYLYNIQKVLNFKVVIVLGFIIFHIQRAHYRFYYENSKGKAQPSDYAIQLTGIPRDRATKGLESAIRALFADPKYEIREVIVSYELKDTIDLYQSLHKLLTAHDAEKDPKRKEKLQEQISETKSKIEAIHQENPFNKTTGHAVVIFQYPDQADQVFWKYDRTWLAKLWGFFRPSSATNLTLDGATLHVSRPPEPTDIIWENLGVGFRERFLRGVVTNFIGMLILVVNAILVCFLVYHLKFLRDDLDKIEDEIGPVEIFDRRNLLIILLPLPVKIIQLVLPIFIYELITHHKQRLYSDLQEEVAIFGVFYSVVNELLVNLLYALKFQDYFGEFGLIAVAINIMVTTFIIDILGHLLDLHGWLGTLQRLFFLKCTRRKYTQQELNELYEMPRPFFADRYASMIYRIYIAAFYTPILPVASLIITVGFFLDSKLEKINFLRKRSFTRECNGDFSVKMIRLVYGGLFVFAVSGFIFDYFLIGKSTILYHSSLTGFCLASIIASGCFWIYPSDWLLKSVMKEEAEKDGMIKFKSHDEMSKDPLFACHDYISGNPVSRLKKVTELVGMEGTLRPPTEMIQNLITASLSRSKSISNDPAVGSSGLIQWLSSRSRKLAMNGIANLIGKQMGMNLAIDIEDAEKESRKSVSSQAQGV